MSTEQKAPAYAPYKKDNQPGSNDLTWDEANSAARFEPNGLREDGRFNDKTGTFEPSGGKE